MKRRGFIKQSFWGIPSFLVFGGLYSWKVEPHWLEFVRVKMPVRNLPDNLAGKTLMQFSDLHIGKEVDKRFLINSFKRAARFKPDFVAYTGDFVSSHREAVQYPLFDEVMTHAVRGRLGTVGVLGNHDYGLNFTQSEVADKLTHLLNDRGITILRNEQREVAGLNFIGFDDYWGMNFNPGKAMADHDPSRANIALCHNPDVCDLQVWQGYDSWILSGHTHGGQCKPPFLPPPRLPVENKRYTSGKFTLDGRRTLYINRALGHIMQVRFNVRPEITIFELEKA